MPEGNAVFFAFKGDFPFCHIAVRRQEADVFICAFIDCAVHCRYESGPAVRINGMVSGVIGYEYGVKVVAFCKTGCNGKHYSVTEGDNGAFHVVCIVVGMGNIGPALKYAALEIFADKVDGYNQVLDSQFVAVVLCTSGLGFILLCSICECHRQGNLFLISVQEASAVHSSRIYKYRFHC